MKKITIKCFSFYPAKILGSAGDAGAIATDDEEVYKFAMEYRNHWKSDYSKWGINSRLDNILASELSLKLSRIDKTLARRKEIAMMYCKGLPENIQPIFSENRVWQDYIIQCASHHEREDLFNFLKENDIETMKNEYPMPCGKLSNAAKYEAETLRLPINEVLIDEEIKFVIEKINEFFSK